MTIKLGNTTINKIYLGSTEIKKIYLGSTLIYNKTATLWTPAQLGSSTLKLWLDASDISTITKDGSGYVSEWRDKSGNGFVAAQSTGSYQPQYKAADDVSSMPAVDWTKWTRTSQYMDVYDASGTRASFANIGDLFTVASYKDGVDSAADDQDRIVDAGDNNSHGEYLAINSGGSTLQTTRILRSVSFNGSGSYSTTILPMSDDICHFEANSILQNKYIRLGADTSTYADARKWRGPVHELIILSRNATTQEIRKCEGYLAHKWGLTDKLPGDHPYKTNPPAVNEPQSYVLDVLASLGAYAKHAWSLRKLSDSYTGYCLRAQRYSDNVQVDVSFDNNGILSLDSPITIVSGTTNAMNLGQFVAAQGYDDVDNKGTGVDCRTRIWYDQAGSINLQQTTYNSMIPLVLAGELMNLNGYPLIGRPTNNGEGIQGNGSVTLGAQVTVWTRLVNKASENQINFAIGSIVKQCNVAPHSWCHRAATDADRINLTNGNIWVNNVVKLAHIIDGENEMHWLDAVNSNGVYENPSNSTTYTGTSGTPSFATNTYRYNEIIIFDNHLLTTEQLAVLRNTSIVGA